jgi:hypothetical protein
MLVIIGTAFGRDLHIGPFCAPRFANAYHLDRNTDSAIWPRSSSAIIYPVATDCDRAARVAWWHGSCWAHGSLKIILSGRSSGNLCSRVLVTGLQVLVCARVLRGQHADLQGRNAGVRNGKEKVYGSIP